MSVARAPAGDSLVLGGVSWQTYLCVLRAFDDRHLRITYDRGELEIMAPSPGHAWLKRLLGYLVFVLVEELGWNMAGFGSMNFRRRKRKRGLEPDQCYWIENEPLVRGRDRIDLRTDPPPDLVIEIDWTRSLLDRRGIYAVFGISELWCFDGQSLRIYLLGPDCKYAESERGRAFPFLPPAELTRFLGMRATLSETDLVRQFRTWVRERIAAGWQ